jgi:hypothetical protein
MQFFVIILNCEFRQYCSIYFCRKQLEKGTELTDIHEKCENGDTTNGSAKL